MANKIQVKRGLVATIPVGDVGELLFTTDTKDLYVGDGATNNKLQKDLGFTPINTTEKGANNGVATLDGTGKIPTGQLPNITITDTFVVANQAAQLALAAEVGDVAVRTDLNKSFILRVAPATVIGNWQELLSPPSAVSSVNGQTGAVVLTTTNIGEGTNLYYTDARVAANAAVVANTAKVTNATHTGDVTGATVLTIANNVVSNAKLATVTTATIKGRATAGSGNVEDLTVAQVRTLVVADANIDGGTW